MSLTITSQNNIPTSLALASDVSETPRPSSSEDFISKIITIVTESAQKRDFDQIDVPLKALIAERPALISSETCHALVQQIKDLNVFTADLPTIYRHLILDLRFKPNPSDFDLLDFSTYNEEFRIACAKLAAQRDSRTLSQFIKNYNITSQDALVEIAKLVAQEDSWGVSAYIQNYGIMNQNALVEIAKLAAQQDAWGVSVCIQNYDIKDQDALVEIAKLAAQQSVVNLSRYIQNYGITSQDALIEIAKFAAQQDGDGVGVSEYIQNYGIKNQDALVEIAKLATQQNGRAVSRYIQKYGIKDQDALVKIAKLAAQQSDERVSRYIQNYGITSQVALVEIAKLAAQQDNAGVSEYIQNYGITDQVVLVEIAKLAAQQSGEGVSRHIQNYGITSQDTLVKIAILAIKKSGFSVFSLLKNYNLNQNNRTILIARFVNAFPEIMQNMAVYFPEKDRNATLEKYPELRIFGINDSPFSEFNSLFEIYNVPAHLSEKRSALYQAMRQETDPRAKAIKMNMFRAFCSILDFSDGSPSLLQKFSALFASIEQEHNPHIQEQKISLIAALLMHCRASNVDKKALDEQFSPLNEIFDLQDPELRSSLSNAFVENLTNSVLQTFIKKNLSGIPQKNNQCAAADLALVLLAPLINNMVPYVELHFATNRSHVLDLDVLDPNKISEIIHRISFIQRMKGLLSHNYFQRDRLKTKSLLRSLVLCQY